MSVNSYCRINNHVIVFDSVNMLPVLTNFEKIINQQNHFSIRNIELSKPLDFEGTGFKNYIVFVQFFRAYYLIMRCNF